MKKLKILLCLFVSVGLAGTESHARAAEKKLAAGHVPAVVRHLVSVGEVATNRVLKLAIGLPLRQPEALAELLIRLADPASPDYRRFLTPEEFNRQFAPTPEAYEAVVRFAATNHLQITARHANRLVLDVSGSARAVDQAFHIRLKTFHHPTENRIFFAPDTEPTVAAELPILDVSGFSDLTPPHARFQKIPASAPNSRATARSGSAAGGAYFGNDFRAAYVPGTPLNGAGQTVGLVQFDGFYSNDIVAYVNQAGLPIVPVQTVLLDGYNGVPTTGANSGNGEVSLDIEMAIAMAPGLAKVIVYTGGPSGIPNDILNSMAVANAAKQLSCSWGWSGGPSATTDQIFQQMAAQGQSFFLASGDSDAFTAGASSVNGVDNAALANAPSDSPYVTVVGGTTLTTSGPGGAWVAETTWNWGLTSGKYVGSSGGSSSYYALPVWQQGVSMNANGGSASFRNLPDVALTADNVYVIYGNGVTAAFGGTSCAAPLWAGFMALVNQQAASYGLAPVGFANPALYTLGKTANYTTNFRDVTTGNNAWPSSPNQFYATNGYDLCTGWGTPAGLNLINALAPQPDDLNIAPSSVFNFTGPFGGGFTPSTFALTLTNLGSNALNWAVGNSAVWLNVTPASGNLSPGAGSSVTANLSSAATNLLPGNYATTLAFTNLNSGGAQIRTFNLQVTEPLLLNPTNGFNATGLVGGPFNTNSQIYGLTNAGGRAWSWSVLNTSLWLSVSPAAGTLAAGGQGFVTVSLNSVASNLPSGTYSATLGFTNGLTGGGQNRTFIFQPSLSLVQNGGFETGDFTSWNRSGNSNFTSISPTSSYVHSGVKGLRTGPSGTLGFLAQTLPTVPGKTYFISYWLANPAAGTPNEFRVMWDGNIYLDLTNLPALGWTNGHFLARASTSSTPLQFGFQNNPNYFGFDEVSVIPVAVPVGRLLGKTNATVQLAWDTTVGLIYQVQYQTNLATANWLNYGSPFTATNSIYNFSDSGLTDAQRFYRIAVQP